MISIGWEVEHPRNDFSRGFKDDGRSARSLVKAQTEVTLMERNMINKQSYQNIMILIIVCNRTTLVLVDRNEFYERKTSRKALEKRFGF